MVTLNLEPLVKTYRRLMENRFRLNRELTGLRNEQERLKLLEQKLDIQLENQSTEKRIEEKRKQLE